MKKERKIIIKNPKLRRIRSNLRKILIEAKSRRLDDLAKLEDSIINEHGLEDDRLVEIQNQINEVLSLMHGSICQCGNGVSCLSLKNFLKENPIEKWDSTDLDMAYYPKTKKWYCLECYKRTKAISEPENL
ncbi:MAG: hypothetical protein ACFFA3_17590 [Promethearchaeota archaeon]